MKIKSELKRIITCQRDIILTSKTMTEYLTKNLLECYSPHIIDICARMDSYLVAKPEVRECGVEQLLQNLNSINDEESESKASE